MFLLFPGNDKPKFESLPSAGWLSFVSLVTLFLSLWAVYHVSNQNPGLATMLLSRRWLAIFSLEVIVAVLSLGIVVLILAGRWLVFERYFSNAHTLFLKLRTTNLLLCILVTAFFAYLVISPWGKYLQGFPVRVWFFWLVVVAGAFLLKAFVDIQNWHEITWYDVLGFSWLFAGVVYKIALFIPDISTYPLSLSWSESSRYYFASLFFGENIYGVKTALPVLHPSRYLLQAIPFSLPELPLWFHRLWQVLLWLGTSICTVVLLIRRMRISSHWNRIAIFSFSAWAFLFLFQGPVYYHLLVMVILILAGFNRHKVWLSLGIVILASIWAGISRLNWFPVPGLLAGCIYFLETNFSIDQEDAKYAVSQAKNEAVQTKPSKNSLREVLSSIGKYLRPPILWIAFGTISAFISQYSYAYFSGEEKVSFTSSLTSDLLWYRLFPNPTFPLGVLPAIALVSGPLLILAFWKLRTLHPIRWISLGTLLVILFIGGMVVSLKIGGGSNLHNLDAYLVLLMVMGGYLTFGNIRGDKPAKTMPFRWQSVLLGLTVIVPVMYTLTSTASFEKPNTTQAESDLSALKELINKSMNQGSEILFISQRHLVTFNMLGSVPLVEPYEKVFLMEMAMANNQVYLDEFYSDLQKKRFALIVTERVRLIYKGDDYSFGEENDVWVKLVAEPLMKYYQRKELYKTGIEVLEPLP